MYWAGDGVGIGRHFLPWSTTLDVDIADLYVHATLLDRTPTDGMCSA
jgi:hypothetical protein